MAIQIPLPMEGNEDCMEKYVDKSTANNSYWHSTVYKATSSRNIVPEVIVLTTSTKSRNPETFAKRP